MAKKEIVTDYIVPTAALNECGVVEANATNGAVNFSSMDVLHQFISNPELPTADGNPIAGGVIPLIMAFDKPLHMTSFQLVARVRGLISRAIGRRKIKIRHAGTLDPLAKGVMVICLGRATKLIEQMQAGVKEYYATLQLGATTPSFDLEHPIDQTYPTEHITQEAIEAALEQFKGDIMQVPPAFSACKVEGKRAYDMARNGEQVDLRAKPLRIDEIEMTECDLEHHLITLRVVCSKGTYIRALARDIGIALNSGAHLTALRRTRVGAFNLSRCFTLEAFEHELKSHQPATTEKI